MIEPVNTPCNHELCLSCLAQMCDARNYACPICRNDMTTALESARKTSSLNKFVNKKRWAKIQVAFPQEIKNRRENRTAQLLAESIHNYKRTGIADSVYRSAFSSETAAVLSVISEANEWSEILRAEEARRQAEIEREEELSRIEIERIMNEERTLDSRAISGIEFVFFLITVKYYSFLVEFKKEIEIRTRKQIEEQLSMAEIARIMREEQEVFQVQHNQPQPQLTQIVVNVNTNRA